MSINVNVSGNPVSVKHGKYVSGADYEAKEFDRRKKLRLEQVRQQSKDIAENVRKRVRNEKEKQKSEFERRSEQDLKKWQAKKLLALQQQYQECVQEIGSGHTRAVLEPNPDEILAARRVSNEKIARERGLIAGQELQIQKNEKNFVKAKPVQQKKFSRVIEDTRSKMISNIAKTKGQVAKSPAKKCKDRKDRKYTTDIDISRTYIDSESDTLGSPPTTNNTSSSSSDSSIKRSPKKQKIENIHNDEKYQATTSENISSAETNYKNRYETFSSVHEPPKDEMLKVHRQPLRMQNDSYLSNDESPRPSAVYNKYHLDTRISERIKNRPKPPEPIFPLTNDKEQEFPSRVSVGLEVPSTTSIPDPVPTKLRSNVAKHKTIGSQTSVTNQNVQRKVIDLPTKPTVSLCGLKTSETNNNIKSNKVTKCSQISTAGSSKVRHYDHTNRFTKYSFEQPAVERIDEDSILVLDGSEEQELNRHRQLMDQRDKDALIRGQRALEKEKAHRDYRQMLDSLSTLQKQERIASIAEHPQKFHMSDERLRERQRQQQNRMENVYEQNIEQKRRIVTLEPLNEEPPPDPFAGPFQIRSMDGGNHRNVANWDVNYKNNYMSGNLKDDETTRTQSLQDMLDRINLQRMLLEKEMKALPEDNNLLKLLNDLNVLQKQQEIKNAPDAKRKVSSGSSELDTTSNSETTKDIKIKSTSEHEKKVKSPKHITPKKKKIKKQQYLLKTEGTQTSPNVVTQSVNKAVQSTEAVNTEKVVPKVSEKKSETTCEKKISIASSSTGDSTDEHLCEIVIKIKEDRSDGAKIVVKPTKVVQIKEQEIPPPLPFQQTVKLTSEQKPKQKTVGTSWREEFSKNSIDISNVASTSTSYYSPPEFKPPKNVNKTDKSVPKTVKSSTRDSTRNALMHLLKNHPQQSNIQSYREDTTSSTLQENEGPKLLRYIKTLLSMSRGSIENLGISTGSEVSTPGPSIIETQNNQIDMLPNILRLLNLKYSDLEHLLNASSSTDTQCLSVESITLSSSSSSTSVINWKPLYSSGAQKDANVAELNISDQKPTTDEAEIQKEIITTEDNNEASTSKASYPVLVSKYTELADKCSQRISNLTSMIEKVRQEKLKLLQTSSSSTSSDKENSTAYLDLPSEKTSNGETDKKAEEILSKYLLDIDMSFAEKLKVESNFQGVLNPPKTIVGIEENMEASQKSAVQSEETNFVPFLQDIPKYTQPLENKEEDSSKAQTFAKLFPPNFSLTRPKPPIAIIKTANRHDFPIDVVPHELSTIPEVDTIGSRNTSMKIDFSPPGSPIKDKHRREKLIGSTENVMDVQSLDKREEIKSAFIPIKKSPKKIFSKSEVDNKPTDSKQKSVKNTSIKKSTKDSAGSDSSNKSVDLELEAMLRSMGMGWAVATLRKTQEALALTSSSSSLDISLKQTSVKVSDSSSSSNDVSVRNILQKHLLGKFSADGSINASLLLKELNDISAIHTSNSQDKTNQRTSTPILALVKSGGSEANSYSSANHKPPLFPLESDLSSVRHSDENLFLTIPDDSGKSENNKTND